MSPLEPARPVVPDVGNVQRPHRSGLSMSDHSWSEDFRAQACLRMRENTQKVMTCMGYFDDLTIWDRVNPNTLSMANQLLHLSGNITQYILSSLAGRPDERQRDLEFSVTGGWKKQEVTSKFLGVITEAIRTIEQCTDEQLLRSREVQGFNLTGIGIILHVVEHYSYHTGQIVAWTRQRENRAMGFYDGVNLNTKNQG